MNLPPPLPQHVQHAFNSVGVTFRSTKINVPLTFIGRQSGYRSSLFNHRAEYYRWNLEERKKEASFRKELLKEENNKQGSRYRVTREDRLNGRGRRLRYAR